MENLELKLKDDSCLQFLLEDKSLKERLTETEKL